jgi:hypothetical protein
MAKAAKTATKKIEKLTPELEAQMEVYHDRWIDIGLSTANIERERATDAVKLMYKCGGLEAPDELVFVNGPIEAFKLLKDRKVVKNVDDFLSSIVFGSNEAGWLSFYNYFQEVCDIRECDKLNGLFEVAKTCGWVSVFDKLAVVQERPLHIKMDEQNRLHSENGPAILFRDTFSVYAWHGVRVPAEWIRDKSLDAKTALTWENMEQRRAACEILGWNNVLKELKAKVIDEDEDPMIGTLLRVNVPDIGEEQFLRVLCGTGREFAIPVPPTVKTALQANAWTWDMSPVEFGEGPEIRT